MTILQYTLVVGPFSCPYRHDCEVLHLICMAKFIVLAISCFLQAVLNLVSTWYSHVCMYYQCICTPGTFSDSYMTYKTNGPTPYSKLAYYNIFV